MSKQSYCNIPVTYTKISVNHHTEMRKWLMDNIDPECYDAEDWHSIDGDSCKRKIWFSNNKDAMWFKLVWA